MHTNDMSYQSLPKVPLVPLCTPSLPLPCPQAIADLLSVTIDEFALSKILYTLNHTILLFYLASFTQHNDSEMHPCCRMHQEFITFLLQSSILQYKYTTICLSVCSLIAFGVSSFCTNVCVDTFSLLLNEKCRNIQCVLLFKKLQKCFPKWFRHFTFQQQYMRVPAPSRPCQQLVF